MNLNLKILADGTICQQVLDSAGECRGFKRRNGEWIALEDAASGLGVPSVKPTEPAPSMHGNALNGRWSRAHAQCVRCHKTDRRHAGNGLCVRCALEAK